MKKFLFNTLILTGTSFFLQFSWLVFNIYISQRAGAASMGLYQLVMSVYRFAVTFAISGIGLTATKAVAEEKARGGNVCGVMRRCLLYAFCFGFAAQILMLCFGDFIGTHFLRDSRTALSLKIIGVSLPYLSMSACIDGYFTAESRISQFAFCQISELVIRMAATVFLLETVFVPTAENTCIAITSGGCAGEIISFIISVGLYAKDRKCTGKTRKTGAKVVRTALPLAVSSYVRSGLSSAEHMLIPPGLEKYGMSRREALEKYGIVHGMAMPVIMFASAFLYSAASLIVPELSACAAKKDMCRINRIVTKNFRFTMIFSAYASAVMLVFGDLISLTVYKSLDISLYIKLLAPLAAVMYLDSSVDGMLKGLNEQVKSMEYNIIDSAVSLVLVCILIPHLGIGGYMIVIFISEILNASLSIMRLIKITDFKTDLMNNVILPVMCAAISVFAAKITLPVSAGYVGLIVVIAVSALFYFALISLTIPQDRKAD